MAYSDYGAFVYKNDVRRTDKEDVAVFASDEETFGCDSEEIPSGARIFVSLMQQRTKGAELSWYTMIHHGIMGDGPIRVICHKCRLPDICEIVDGEIVDVEYLPPETNKYDNDDYDIVFDYKGYHFRFVSGKPCEAYMTEPDGTKWECYYGYEYGAGFEGELYGNND